MSIEIYTTGPGCQKCQATKRHFKNRDDVTVHNLVTDGEPEHVTQLLAAMREAGKPIVAPIVIVRDGETMSDWWTDFRPDKIKALTH